MSRSSPSRVPFRPLTAYPRAPTGNRRASRFDSDLSKTMKLLGFELEKIKAGNAVVQVGSSTLDFRADGTPRTRYVAPPVVLFFDRDKTPVSMPCDTFTDWRDNLRAIALSLEALRAVDRYGVTQNGEQYRGWEALPPAPNTDPERDFASEIEAAVWLNGIVKSEFDVDLMGSQFARKKAYQIAARKLHPDAGGAPAMFRLLQKAKEILGI